ncbi:MAG: glycosyltransferase [Chitinivibrionales bacterium]|nr:glycosyltransferase [Chitinivibrionales bacterium]MBD3397309.1 glycosyltransferase [Chitinivibrionales bacterium]
MVLDAVRHGHGGGVRLSQLSAGALAVNKPLIVHNHYLQRGGEDVVFETESALLRDHGHQVLHYTLDNRAVAGMGAVSLFTKTLWNSATYRDLTRCIRDRKPDLVHFHNTFPLVSPSAYYAVKRAGLPVVQTLHNYRLVCPEARFFRDGRVCELCLRKRIAWPAVRYGCYQNSRPASAAVTAMLSLHHALGTWRTKVDRYIALTEFARAKFCAGGLSPEKVAVKPNGLARDPGAGPGGGGYVLFAGRLSPEKGIDTLLDAWPHVPGKLSLKIAGDGPLVEMAAQRASALEHVEFLGQRTHDEVLDLMRHAEALVVPSRWYEGFPMTVVEAFATGLPVVASRLGGLTELIRHGETGLHFDAGNTAGLAAQIRQVCVHADHAGRMRAGARREFERKYAARRNYESLVEIYQAVLAEKRGRTA